MRVDPVDSPVTCAENAVETRWQVTTAGAGDLGIWRRPSMDRSAHERLQPSLLPVGDSEGSTVWPAEVLAGGDDAPPHKRLSRLVQTLEREIIPRLVQAHRNPSHLAVVPVAVAWPDLRTVARLTYANDELVLRRLLHDLRAGGCAIERLYVELLAPAARELGLMWEDDLCDFTDVTVGVGRLQQLLRELSPAFGAEIEHPQDGRRILLLPAPGEQHTLGASMAAEFFRRAGWDVSGGVSGTGLDPVQAVQSEWFDILGLSAGQETRVDWLRDCITTVRQVSRNRAIGILVGGPLFIVAPEYGAAVGADTTVTDGQAGPGLAESLLASRIQR
jgi:methanogenic corrinoid protein MtbC1